jgi:hypothetical protein
MMYPDFVSVSVMYPGFVSVSVMCSTDVSLMCSTDYAEGLENVFHTCVS